MDRFFLRTLIAFGAGLTLAGPACTGAGDDEEPSCLDAHIDGSEDARASNPSCFECGYEDAWDISVYETKELMRCYANGFHDVYDYECLEECQAPEVQADSCCRAGMDFVSDQIHALGLYGVETEY